MSRFFSCCEAMMISLGDSGKAFHLVFAYCLADTRKAFDVVLVFVIS